MQNTRAIRPWLAIVVLALASFLLGACAGARVIPIPIPVPVTMPSNAPAAAATTAAPAATASGLEGVDWKLTSYSDADGKMADPVAEVLLTFADGQLTGNTGCNGYTASYTLDGDKITLQPGMSTTMACDDPVNAQETAVRAALEKAATFAVADGKLTLSDASGNALLEFAAQQPVALVGTPWEATMVNNNRQAVTGVIEGTKITANFGGDGQVNGSAGCNNYFAGYKVDGDKLTIDHPGSTMMACADPAGIMEQETAYLTQLAKAATYTIRGDELEIRDADGALIAMYRPGTAASAPSEAVALTEAAVMDAEEPVLEPTSADPDPVDVTAKLAPVEVAAPAAQTPTGKVTAELGVNVRIGPGTEYPAVGLAPLGTEGEIIGKSEDGLWWAARVNAAPDQTGWVSAAHVDATGADNVPVLPAPPLPAQTAAIQQGTGFPIAAGTILYSASRVVQDGNRVYELEDIYAVPATPGSTPVMVANNAMQPALSPDRSTLAMHSTQSDKLGLGGFDVATGQRLRFSNFIEDESPRWSPAGDQLVFASNRQGDRRWRIYITPAADQERPADMVYTELARGKDPDWHPSQNLIILKGCDDQGQNCGLYTMSTDGSNRQIVTNVAADSMPRWLPDGSGFVFMSDGRDGNWEIYRADATGQNVTRLTSDPAADGLPAVSPDGTQVAFVSNRGGSWAVWVTPLVGGDATKIADIAGALPDWLTQAVDWVK